MDFKVLNISCLHNYLFLAVRKRMGNEIVQRKEMRVAEIKV